jgi:hypothetical protein
MAYLWKLECKHRCRSQCLHFHTEGARYTQSMYIFKVTKNTHKVFIPGFTLGKPPNFLVYPPIRTTISFTVHFHFFLWLVWSAFLSSRSQAFSPSHPPKPRPMSRLTRTSVVCLKHREEWKISTTSQACHASGSFNPVAVLQTNGMVQPTLPVRKRWKQTQWLPSQRIFMAFPLFFFFFWCCL